MFQEIEELLSGGFVDLQTSTEQLKTDRVLKSTRIEQAIFDDLHSEAEALAECEQSGGEKLKTFDSLVNDVFQSVYTLQPKYIEETALSALSKQFNRSILDSLMADETYPAVKNVCEGKELPALSATEEFSEQLLDNLDALLDRATGGKGKADAIDKMQRDKENLLEKLQELLEKREHTPEPERGGLDQKILRTANRVLAKSEQAELFEKLMENNLRQSRGLIRECVANAAEAALEKARETKNALLAWGDGDTQMQKNELNTEVLKRCAGSEKLRYIAQFLGRYKQMLNSKRLAGYTYGRGEKYDIEYGNTISRTLTSDLALLADTSLLPLFVRKYRDKGLKQYRRRESEYKGKGDIIVCLDESGSTFGENSAYGMAIAMVLYELCKINHTSFALVHFASRTKTYIFPKDRQIPGNVVLECAETLLGGGTNFDNPLQEACRLMLSEDFEKPDVVFITDGVCAVSPEILDVFQQMKSGTGAKLTGILLDKGNCMDFTLNLFADNIYRTSELLQEQIVENLIEERL